MTLCYCRQMNTFGQFYESNKKKVFAYLMRLSGDYHLSGDILQECFTRYLEKYGPSEPRLPLVFRIARNVYFDHLRGNERNTTLTEEPVARTDGQEHQMMVKEHFQQVMTAMQRLNARERDLLALVASSGLSYAEIASITGYSQANVKVSIHRARKHLLNIVKEQRL